MVQTICYNGMCIVRPCLNHDKYNGFIPKKLIVAVQYYENADEWMTNDICECESGEESIRIRKSLVNLKFPLYRVSVKNEIRMRTIYDSEQNCFVADEICDYILDPVEHEHMERYLAGTDDPMYDYVHELRYNPRSIPISDELAEANDRLKRLKPNNL